jgi:pimeloyl-ACP methyl ester carboxylesterase
MAFLLLGGGVMAGAMGQEIAFITLAGLVVAGFVLLIAADQMFFSPVLGDAARYLRPSPKNVSRRQEIRDQGLKLIEALHETGKYDRIVLVGHSLGGVIAYELIVHLWGRRHREMDQEGPLQDVLAEVEAAARALDDAPENAALFEAWRAAQARFFDAVRDSPTTRKGGKPWLISDLVTLGCPLAHADTVMAKDPAEFALLKQRREILTSPPWLEPFADGARRFSYCRLPGQSESSSARPRAPHNSAAFAAVRWTNLYFPMEGLARGDLIAGPCRRVFGPGLRDVAVRAPHKNGFNPHMDYFSCEITKPGGDESMANHIEALRAAIGLEEKRD